jgi:hypothetical protein
MTPQIFPGLNRNYQLTISPTGAVKCNKKDCFFCHIMIGKPLPKVEITGHNNKFSKDEIYYILNTYSKRNSAVITEIAKRLMRTRKAIMQKYHKVTHQK